MQGYETQVELLLTWMVHISECCFMGEMLQKMRDAYATSNTSIKCMFTWKSSVMEKQMKSSVVECENL